MINNRDFSRLKVLLPLLLCTISAIVPILSSNYNLYSGTQDSNNINEQDSADQGTNLDFQDDGGTIEESIDLDPEYVSEVVSNTSQNFEMTDMVYGFSYEDQKNFLVVAGKTWTGPTNSSNTTWAFIVYEIVETAGGVQLIYNSMRTPSGSDAEYNSAFSCAVIVRYADPSTTKAILFGGNITRNNKEYAMLAGFYFDSHFSIFFQDQINDPNGGNFTFVSMAVGDVNNNYHDDFVATAKSTTNTKTDYFIVDFYNTEGMEKTIYDFPEDQATWSTIWNDVKIVDLNYDNRSEIVAGGYIQIDSPLKKVPIIITLNLNSSNELELTNVKVFDDEPDLIRDIDFSGYDMGIKPVNVDGWVDVSSGYFNEIKTRKYYSGHYEVLEFYDPDPSGDPGLVNTFTALDYLKLQFDIAFESNYSSNQFAVLYTSDGSPAAGIYIANGSLYAVDKNYGWHNLNFTLNPKQWYQITFYYKYNQNGPTYYSVALDDHILASLQPLNNSSQYMNMVNFFSSDASSTNKFYIDNLRIYDLNGFNNSEISSLDADDVNQDGITDLILSINHESSNTGNYSTQLVMISKLLPMYDEDFNEYFIEPESQSTILNGKGLWTAVDSGGATSTIDKAGDGNNQLSLKDPNDPDIAQAWWELPGTVPDQGEISFYIKSTDPQKTTNIYLADGYSNKVGIPVDPDGTCHLMIFEGVIYAFSGSSSTDLTEFIDNKWYKITIQFDINLGWTVKVNDEIFGGNYGFNFTNAPTRFDHFEITTDDGPGSGEVEVYVDNIDVDWEVGTFQTRDPRSWDLYGNVALEPKWDATNYVLTLKRNDGNSLFDISSDTKAMIYGFNEIKSGYISFWMKTKKMVNAPFQICNLYQAGASGYPYFFRLAVDANNNIGRNWSTSFIDSGADWTDDVWHFIEINFQITSDVTGDSTINVTYDGMQIFTNVRHEYTQDSVNNVSFELSENFAGYMYIDDLNIGLSPESVYYNFNVIEKTKPLYAGPSGSQWSLKTNDIIVSNPDEDPYKEIQLGFTFASTNGFWVPAYHKFEFKDGQLEFDGNPYIFNQSNSAFTAKIKTGDLQIIQNKTLFLGGNYYDASAGKNFFFLEFLNIDTEKGDVQKLPRDDLIKHYLIQVHDSYTNRSYTDIELGDVDLDGRDEVVVLSNDLIDPDLPFYIQVFHEIGGELKQVAEQSFKVPTSLPLFRGFRMKDMLIKDVDGDNIQEVVVAGSILGTTRNPYGCFWVLQYNFDRKWSNDKYFLNNSILDAPFQAAIAEPFQFGDAFGGPYPTQFLSIDALDVDYDGIDEIVCGGYYISTDFSKAPGVVTYYFDRGKTNIYVVGDSIVYRDDYPTLQGQVNDVKFARLEPAKDRFQVICGSNTTFYQDGSGPYNHAEVRIYLFDNNDITTPNKGRMAVWMFPGESGSIPEDYNVFNIGEEVPYDHKMCESKLFDIELMDVDKDGLPEILTGGYFRDMEGTLPGYLFGSTHIIDTFEENLNLLNYTIFDDENLRNSTYYDIVVGNIDYDANVEIVSGGESSFLGDTNHDLITVVNNNHAGPLREHDLEAWRSETTSKIVINEVANGKNEMVELYNYGETTMMTGWSLIFYKDDYQVSPTFTFPTEFQLNKGGFVSIQDGDGENTLQLLFTGFIVDWVDGPLAVGLFDDEGSCVDWFQTSNYVGPMPQDALWTSNKDLSVIEGHKAYRNSDTDKDEATDWIAVIGDTTDNKLNPGQFGNNHLSKVNSVEIDDIDNDGVPEIITLIGHETRGWFISIYNKTKVVDSNSPEIMSLNDTANVIGGNITVFQDDFEYGLNKWESSSGLWHITGSYSIWPNSYHSYNQSVWYGNESTGTYDTGQQTWGNITSMPFNLSKANQAYLEFYTWRECDGLGNFSQDMSRIYISTDGFNWNLIDTITTNLSPWTKLNYNISQYCGNSTVQIMFDFQTLDGFDNNYRGWLIDDVKVYTNYSRYELGIAVSDQSPVTLSNNATGGPQSSFPPYDTPWISGVSFDEKRTHMQYFEFNSSYLQPYWNHIRFDATDEIGNFGTSLIPIYYDQNAPIILITSPYSFQGFDSSPSFTVIVSDDWSIRRAWYELYAPWNGTKIGPIYFSSNGTISESDWNALPEEQPIVWRFYAEDTAGNIGCSMVYFFKDLDPPNVTIHEPLDYQVFSSPANLSYTVEIQDFAYQSSWYDVYVPSQGYWLGPTAFTENGTIDNNTWSQIPDGEVVEWWFYATDYAGNTGSDFVFIEKDTTLADIQITYVTAPSIVVQNQEGIEIEVFVENIGFNNATITDIAISIKSNFTDNTGDFDIHHSFSLPITLAPSGAISFYFYVDVHPDAWTGINETIDAWVNAIDDRTYDYVGQNGSNSPSTWTVIQPSNLQIINIQDVPDNNTYVQGMSFTIRVTLHNYGETRVTISSLTLSFTMDNGEHATGYSYSPVGTFIVPSGATVTKDVVISTTSNSSSGNITIDAVAKGIEQYTGYQVLAFTNLTQPFTWSTTETEIAYSICGYGEYLYSVGFTNATGNEDLLLIKWDKAGNQVWNRTWGGTGNERGYDVICDNGTTIYTVGTTNSFGNGNTDVLIIRWDKDGNQIWNATWGTAGVDIGRAIDIYDHLLYITGETNGQGVGLFDNFLLYFNSSGYYQWHDLWGTIFNEYSRDIWVEQTFVYTVGYKQSTIANGTNDGLCVKWDRIFTGGSATGTTWDSGFDDILNSVYSVNNQLYAAGHTFNGIDYDVLLLSIDPDTLFINQSTTYASAGDDYCIDIKSDGNYLYTIGYSDMSGNDTNFDTAIGKWHLNLTNAGYRYWGGQQNDYAYSAWGDQSYYYMTGSTGSLGLANYNVLLLKGSMSTEKNNTKIFMQTQADVIIISMQDVIGRGVYVEGESFDIRVTYKNYGGTDALNVTGVLDFGSATYLSSSTPSPVTVYKSNGTATQTFTVTVLDGATNVEVNIICSASGIENISSRSLSIQYSGAPLEIIFLDKAELVIDGISDLTGRGVYVAGETFQIGVNVANLGGTSTYNVVLDLNPLTAEFLELIWTPTDPFGLDGYEFGYFVFNCTVPLDFQDEGGLMSAYISGYEAYTNRFLEGYGDDFAIIITIQSQANLNITQIEDRTGRGTYVEGESFVIRVYYENSGGTRILNADGLLDFSGYSYLSQSNPAPKTINSYNSSYQDFTVTVLPNPINANVTIQASANGTEEYTNRILNDTSDPVKLNVTILKKANLTITSIQDVTGRGEYVEGESFVIRVNYQNSGGTAALNVDAALDFNMYSYLSANDSLPVNVTGGGTNHQDFLITVLSGAVTSVVQIDATASGTEQYTNRTLSCESGDNDLTVNIYKGERTDVTAVIDLTGAPSYKTGQSLLVRVTITNIAGGVDALNGTCNLTFGSATGYSATNTTNNEDLVVPHGSQITVTFNVTIDLNATTGNILIDANFIGNEEFTGDVINITGANSPETIFVKQPSKIRISSVIDITNQPAYVQGQSLVVRVHLDNTEGNSNVENGTLNLEFSATGYNQNATYTNITVPAGDYVNKYFNVTIDNNATTGNIIIDARFTGDTVGGDPVNITADSPETIVVQSSSNLKIIDMDWVSGNGTYVQGMSFTINVSLHNYGGTAVNDILLSLNFTGTGYSYTPPALFSVQAGSTVNRTISISIDSNATTGTIIINSTAQGTEAVTGRTIHAYSGKNNTQVNVQAQANLIITSIVDVIGRGVYVEGENFTVRVNYQNTGGTDALNVDATLDFNGYGFLSSDNPAAVTIPAGGNASQTFTVTVLSGATNAPVTIDASATGTEEYSNRALSATSGTNDLS
ncbi:MAG: hypothetical protein ACXQS8_00695, partial [Candidatus Helarchaeales archaeon]